MMHTKPRPSDDNINRSSIWLPSLQPYQGPSDYSTSVSLQNCPSLDERHVNICDLARHYLIVNSLEVTDEIISQYMYGENTRETNTYQHKSPRIETMRYRRLHNKLKKTDQNMRASFLRELYDGDLTVLTRFLSNKKKAGDPTDWDTAVEAEYMKMVHYIRDCDPVKNPTEMLLCAMYIVPDVVPLIESLSQARINENGYINFPTNVMLCHLYTTVYIFNACRNDNGLLDAIWYWIYEYEKKMGTLCYMGNKPILVAPMQQQNIFNTYMQSFRCFLENEYMYLSYNQYCLSAIKSLERQIEQSLPDPNNVDNQLILDRTIEVMFKCYMS